ncbi:unnamed protein product [Symbiodinium sp. CCMP2456]|nr:unnamed protein product [Symbiodinium sp. CCMP2456]
MKMGSRFGQCLAPTYCDLDPVPSCPGNGRCHDPRTTTRFCAATGDEILDASSSPVRTTAATNQSRIHDLGDDRLLKTPLVEPVSVFDALECRIQCFGDKWVSLATH